MHPVEPCDFDFDLGAAQVSAVGDWEVKYGNPVLSVDGYVFSNSELERILF